MREEDERRTRLAYKSGWAMERAMGINKSSGRWGWERASRSEGHKVAGHVKAENPRIGCSEQMHVVKRVRVREH